MNDYKLNLLDNTLGRDIAKIESEATNPVYMKKIMDGHSQESRLLILQASEAVKPFLSPLASGLLEKAAAVIYDALNPPSQPDPTVPLKDEIAKLEAEKIESDKKISVLKWESFEREDKLKDIIVTLEAKLKAKPKAKSRRK